MAPVFSVPIFFIVFREALEASIIISVLLALVEQIVQQPGSTIGRQRSTDSDEKKGEDSHTNSSSDNVTTDNEAETRALVKKMRFLIFAGSAVGLFVALAIGAAFLAVWFTEVTDLFSANEEIWEGTFNLIASVIIFVMGLTMLRIDKAKAKWRTKLHKAFLSDVQDASAGHTSRWARWNPFRTGSRLSKNEKAEISGGKWALFLLPFITVMREGLEAVVFIGGVSLGQKATAIPLATIIGLICGLGVGFIIYKSSSRTSISIFLIISTNLLLLVGAGLFSKAIGNFERRKFNKIVGADVAEAGNGPGSYDVRGNIWHLNCCNPEDKFGNGGWAIFAAIFGWSNNGSLGTVLGYIFYWIAVVVVLVVMNINEKKNRRRNAAQTA